MATGSGTGTAISCGAGTGLSIAEPLPYTLLALPRYAKLFGIHPAHFMGGVGDDEMALTSNRCNDLWPHYSWQSSDRVSHYDLAEAIQQAEGELARYMGWWPAPVWTTEEVRQYPRHHRPDVTSFGRRNVRGYDKSVMTVWGKVIAPGQRATESICTVTVAGGSLAYTDEDGDGVCETATVTCTTTATDPAQVKVYIANTSADPRWEIRPARSKAISSGTFTGIYDPWLFIDPDILSTYPGVDGWSGIDVDNTASYVTSADVYREYNDTSADSSQFWWEPGCNTTICSCGGSGCTVCTLTTQDGCFHIRDAERGVVVPAVGTYSEGWVGACQTTCREPDFVKLWYYSGLLRQDYVDGVVWDPLGPWWAQTIAYLATARLERQFCNCGNATGLATWLREDLALAGEHSYSMPFEQLGNPFGTRRGEIMAWQRVSKLAQDRLEGAAAV